MSNFALNSNNDLTFQKMYSLNHLTKFASRIDADRTNSTVNSYTKWKKMIKNNSCLATSVVELVYF